MAQFNPAKLGRNVQRIVKILGSDLEVGLQILSSAQRLQCDFNTEEKFKDHKIDSSVAPVQIQDAYVIENFTQQIFLFSVDPDYIRDGETGLHKPYFKTLNDVRILDDKQILDLIRQYEDFKQEINGENITDEDLMELKKNFDKIIFSITNLNILRKLAISLENDLRILRKGNGLNSRLDNP